MKLRSKSTFFKLAHLKVVIDAQAVGGASVT